MGRRSRARAREQAAPVATADSGAAPAPRRRRGWPSALNPFKFRQLTRSRARAGAVGFGVLALVCMLLGRVFEDVAWYSSAVLLAILAVVWGLSSALLGKDDPSG
jgi:hypothetical protein